ncbi:MAG: mechanosensitive ion channel [Methanotrichaceae archaeon]|nr:mechanosensitive ion channel [Methanotrichaceae archaeon]
MNTLEYTVVLENDWFWPLIFVVSGFVAGVIFKKFIFPKLWILASKTKWKADIVLGVVAKYSILWCALAGFYIADLIAPLSESVAFAIKTALLVIAAFSVTIALSGIAREIVTQYARKHGEAFQETSTFNILINGAALIICILIVLKAINIDITPFLAALGIGSLAVALALQEPLGNFFSGLNIVASSQIRTGDYIKLDSGDEGVITDISWRSTTMLTPSNQTACGHPALKDGVCFGPHAPFARFSGI